MKFPKVPEVEWIREHVEMLTGYDELPKRFKAHNKRLMHLYRYLLWSRRYGILGRDRGTTPEYQVCYGFVIKYHRLLFSIPLSHGEKILVERSEKALKAGK